MIKLSQTKSMRLATSNGEISQGSAKSTYHDDDDYDNDWSSRSVGDRRPLCGDFMLSESVSNDCKEESQILLLHNSNSSCDDPTILWNPQERVDSILSEPLIPDESITSELQPFLHQSELFMIDAFDFSSFCFPPVNLEPRLNHFHHDEEERLVVSRFNPSIDFANASSTREAPSSDPSNALSSLPSYTLHELLHAEPTKAIQGPHPTTPLIRKQQRLPALLPPSPTMRTRSSARPAPTSSALAVESVVRKERIQRPRTGGLTKIKRKVVTKARTPSHVLHDPTTCDGVSSSSSYTDVDVLLGRGGLINHHPGNQAYLQEKVRLQVRYRAASKPVKTAISQELVHWVQARGGRFLELQQQQKRIGGPQSSSLSLSHPTIPSHNTIWKDDTNASSSRVGGCWDRHWVEVTNKRARNKASQTLRESV